MSSARRWSPLLALLPALGCGSEEDLAAEVPPGAAVAAALPDPSPSSEAPDEARAERMRSLAESLRTRLESKFASDLGPRISAALIELLDRAGTPKSGRYHPVERGWISTKMARAFLDLNPEWSGPHGDTNVHPIVEPCRPAFETVIDLHRQLAAAGVELLVVPIPSRLNVEPDMLAAVSFDESRLGFAPGLTRWMLALVAEGVEVLDLLPALAAARASGRFEPGQVYLEVNNHWGPDGARVAAHELALALQGRSWFPVGTSASTRLEAVHLQWSASPKALPPGVPAPVLRFERVLGRDGGPAAEQKRASPVVLLGGSFTLIFADEGAGFGRQLHHELGLAADVIAMEGGSTKEARRALARREHPLKNKRVVVWMFPSYNLPAAGWEPISLVR